MKRIGKRLTAGLAFAVASGFALGGLIVLTPATSAAAPLDISDIDWEPRPSLYGNAYSMIRLDADRVERAHEGMGIPNLRHRDGGPITGAPYYFFGKDPRTGSYLPSHILVCIDMLHIDYEVPEGSEYFDLATLLPPETAVRISQTLNAGLQLARQHGMRVDTGGGQPLSFTSGSSSTDYMMAAQITAWHLFARDNRAEPLPYLERSDFAVDRLRRGPGGAVETIVDVDLSKQFAEIDALIERFRSEPSISSVPARLNIGTTTLADPALTGFEVEVDPAASTPGYDTYFTIATKKDGTITFTKKRSIDKPLTIGFRKKFGHGLGTNGLASGVRAANHQFKTSLSNIYTESFTLPVAVDDGSVLVRKSDADGNPLDGAEFALFDPAGTTIALDSWGRPLVGVTGTSGHGRLVLDDVPTGRYLLMETRAPEGYQRDATPREIIVRANVQAQVAGGAPIVNTRETAELEIHKSNRVSVLQPGELTTYEIAIANRSSYTEPVDALIEDVLPDGLRFVSADHGGSYDARTRTVRWNVGPVDGTPIVVSVTARVEDSVVPGTTISNRATVTLDGVCPGHDDVDGCADVDTDVVPALVLMKSNGMEVGLPGGTSAYELTVINTSAAEAPDVVVVDALPRELIFVAADSNGHYADDEHAVSWRLGTLRPGEQRSVRVITWVDDQLSPGAEIENVASVSSGGGCSSSTASSDEPANPDEPPRSKCDAVDIDRVPAVSVAKDDGTTAVVVGERLDYRIVATNDSDVVAPDVIVVDQLPFSTTLVESSIPLADVSTDTVLHWDLGDLAPGEEREIIVSVTVNAEAPPASVIANTATITAAGVCVDDPATAVDECRAVDEDVVTTPAAPGEDGNPEGPVEGETPGGPEGPTIPIDPEKPTSPVETTGPTPRPGATDGEAPRRGIAGRSPAADRLADTGLNLSSAVRLGALAVATLLVTGGVNAIALRRRRGRRSA
ncbi:SpaA isopeptide-forming pilin-related protein [uncultured Leifsonia sp.]|uniref:SpaA isopeptide-forming pilin-related protein n=1 Tax=uncultured Leifsonia sp. TaxID=340359 RepID=UPI0025FC03F1|nr:SpaA isopeptide-forming pilin-related protein [uncultured Leifsonia sp.]